MVLGSLCACCALSKLRAQFGGRTQLMMQAASSPAEQSQPPIQTLQVASQHQFAWAPVLAGMEEGCFGRHCGAVPLELVAGGARLYFISAPLAARLDQEQAHQSGARASKATNVHTNGPLLVAQLALASSESASNLYLLLPAAAAAAAAAATATATATATAAAAAEAEVAAVSQPLASKCSHANRAR